MIFLDTNVISEPLRPSPSPLVVDWLDRQHITTLGITAFTVAELRMGVAILPDGSRRETLATRIERELLPAFEGRIAPFDEPAGAAWASLQATTRARGRNLPLMDSLIAAICISQGATLATRNESDFEGFGLDIINPWRS
ncbi:MAG: type II toxin-antitoxin system VapC family toxin [Propionibacteriaceae bacterium]|nr:type II toxin-antitoxin system VapC family toxin [Propionibacteriaceae bacterium]